MRPILRTLVRLLLIVAGVALRLVRLGLAARTVAEAERTPVVPLQSLGTTDTLTILPLVDEAASGPGLQREHSLAYLIRTDETTILLDKVNYVRGMLDTYTLLWPQLWEADLRRDAPQVDGPVYILEGWHDLNASPYLAEEYHQLLEVPYKELIWFEHSGHSLWIDEHKRFVAVLVERVLAGPQR